MKRYWMLYQMKADVIQEKIDLAITEIDEFLKIESRKAPADSPVARAPSEPPRVEISLETPNFQDQ